MRNSTFKAVEIFGSATAFDSSADWISSTGNKN